MSNFFDENDIVSDKTQKSSFFDEEDISNESQPERTLASIAQDQDISRKPAYDREIGKIEAFKEKALQGGTFNLSDEIQGAGEVLGQTFGVKGLSDRNMDLSLTKPYWLDTDKTAKSIFDETVEKERDIIAQAEKDQPVASTVGTVAGAIASPGLGAAKLLKAVKDANLITKVAVGAGIGGTTSGLAGAGEAEGGLDERTEAAKEAVGPGALVGGAIPLVSSAATGTKELLSKIAKSPIVEDITKAFQRGTKGESLITKAGRQEASDIVRSKSGELFEDIKALQKEIGGKIQNEISSAQESGQKIDLSEEVSDVLARLQKIKAEGSQEAAAYATSVEKEIKKILNIKSADDGFMGVQSKDLPEGLIVPKKQATDLSKVDPKQAQDLKQVLSDYTPKKGMAPQQLEPARVAKELSSGTGKKLSELTNELPELNTQYGLIKDSLKRLGVKENKLPSQIQEKINNMVTKLEKQNVTGDNARQAIEEVLENIKQVNPEIAAKYQSTFSDIVERLNLSEKIIKGGESFSLTGTPKAATMFVSNLAGLGANKFGISKAASKVKNFTQTVMETKPAQEITKTAGVISNSVVNKEPYTLQRQVAKAAETADPELLNEQAEQIRQKYGNQGEQLATMLNNMANKDKDARRALMFTILQNTAYRKMLGLQDEQE